MPFPKSALRRAAPRVLLALLVVGVVVLVVSRVLRRAKQADESVYVVRPRTGGKAPAPTQKPPPPAAKAEDLARRHSVPALVADGQADFHAGRLAAAEEAWQKALIEAQRQRADGKQVGDIVFRMAVAAGKLGRSEEARALAAQAEDFWTQARLSRQDRLGRRKELLKELGVTKDPAGP